MQGFVNYQDCWYGISGLLMSIINLILSIDFQTQTILELNMKRKITNILQTFNITQL